MSGHPDPPLARDSNARPDTDKQLVEMPGVPWAAASVSELLRIRLAELETPLAHRLVADDDTALG